MHFTDRMYYARIWLRVAAGYELAAAKHVHIATACHAAAAEARRCAASCFTVPAPFAAEPEGVLTWQAR